MNRRSFLKNIFKCFLTAAPAAKVTSNTLVAYASSYAASFFVNGESSYQVMAGVKVCSSGWTACPAVPACITACTSAASACGGSYNGDCAEIGCNVGPPFPLNSTAAGTYTCP